MSYHDERSKEEVKRKRRRHRGRTEEVLGEGEGTNNS